METMLLKEDDKPSTTNYGSIGNDQQATTGSGHDFSTGTEEDNSSENEEDVSTENKKADRNKQPEKPPENPQTASNNAPDKDPNRANSRYSTKKNITQGLLNFALLTANASQLRSVLDGGNSSPYFYLLITLLSLSMILQIVAGALMAYVAKCDLNHDPTHQKCYKMNNAVAVLVFLVTAVNVIIPVFGPQPAVNSP